MGKKLIIGLGVIVAVIAVLGFVAPKDFSVESEIVINKPKDFVFQQLKMMKSHDLWSPWAKRDPQMKTTHQGEDGTVGFVSAWDGNDQVGAGEQEIKSIVEGERIDTELRFQRPMVDSSNAFFITEVVSDSQTKVRWGLKDTLTFPSNILYLVMDMRGRLTKDFDEGLAQMKGLYESM
ncbi:MAG: SRPBCC family protein [Bdellovibrionales bacterium]|nr:SRPBCC family protein [Bdellovibrionales bacterium]